MLKTEKNKLKINVQKTKWLVTILNKRTYFRQPKNRTSYKLQIFKDINLNEGKTRDKYRGCPRIYTWFNLNRKYSF